MASAVLFPLRRPLSPEGPGGQGLVPPGSELRSGRDSFLCCLSASLLSSKRGA